MALLQIDFYSKALHDHTHLNLLFPEETARRPADRPVVYLLHGYGGSENDWLLKTNVSLLAEHYGFVLVLPSGGSSFYADLKTGAHYSRFLSQELPERLENWFGITPAKEKTFIAGNSMGGLGALRLALNHPQLYQAAASFSGPLNLAFTEEAREQDPELYEATMLKYGNPESLYGSEHDPEVWLDSYLKNAVRGPEYWLDVVLYAGYEDPLTPLSISFAEKCQAGGWDIPLLLAPGDHSFFYWQTVLEQWLEHLFADDGSEQG